MCGFGNQHSFHRFPISQTIQSLDSIKPKQKHSTVTNKEMEIQLVDKRMICREEKGRIRDTNGQFCQTKTNIVFYTTKRDQNEEEQVDRITFPIDGSRI